MVGIVTEKLNRNKMEKLCPNCELSFTPNSGKQKFCSDKCKVAFARKAAKSLNLKTGNEIKPPEPKNEKTNEEIQITEAGKAILEFCKANKTDFDSLSSWLVENYGKPAKAKNSQSSDIPEKASKFVSNWRSQYVASKTGAKP